MSEVVTWDEYAKHTNNLDCWVLVDGHLYDTTSYLAEHPGGDQILLKFSGFDASARFNAVPHSEYAKSIRDARRVGKIESTSMPEGHTQKVKQIKNEYNEAKKKREEERKSKIQKQMVQSSSSKDSNRGRKFYSKSQISRHNSEEDCWIIYDNKVYQVTKFLNEHPGGPAYITDLGGKDATVDFDKADHSSNAKDIRQKYFIGYVEGTQVATKSKIPSIAVFLVVVLGILYLASYIWK